MSQDWKHLTPVQVAYALLWRTHTEPILPILKSPAA
jgi:hypothetical protein